MAGTRFLIQSSFLAQFMVLIIFAGYFGLYRVQDPLCHHLPMFQLGRRRVRATLNRIQKQQDEDAASVLLPLRVATSQDHTTMSHWKAALRRQGIAAEIVPQEQAKLDRVCLDPKNSDANDGIALWLCPAAARDKSTPESNHIGRIVTTKGTTFLYPYNDADLDAVVEQAFQWDVTYDVPVEAQTKKGNDNETSSDNNETVSENNETDKDNNDAVEMPQFYRVVAPGPVQSIQRRRRPLQVTLMMERRSDWKAWSTALAEWIQDQESALLDWPCLLSPFATNVVLSTYQKKKRKKKIANKTETNSTSNTVSQNTTASSNESLSSTTAAGSNNGLEEVDGAQVFSTSDIEDSIFNRLERTDTLNLILYVPKVTPTWLKDEEGHRSHVFYMDQNFLTTISDIVATTNDEEMGGEHENYYRSFVKNAMAPVHHFLFHQCMGAPHIDHNSFHVNSDGSYPKWNFDLWLQRTLNELYKRARQETLNEGRWLLMSSTSLKIPEEVGAVWKQLEELMTGARQGIPPTQKNDNAWDWQGVFLRLEQALQLLHQLRTDRYLMVPLDFSLPQYLAILAPLCMPLFLPHLVGTFREWKRYKMLQEKKKEKTS